jgi:hypothetical protein
MAGVAPASNRPSSSRSTKKLVWSWISAKHDATTLQQQQQMEHALTQ